MLAPKAGVQAGLGREVNCLKDQVDILRESSYSYNRHEQVLSIDIQETDPRGTIKDTGVTTLRLPLRHLKCTLETP